MLPTDDEYAAYVDPVSGKRWQATPEDWACPVCERRKRQILRKSKGGKWTGGVRSHVECTLETDTLAVSNRRRLFPDFPNDLFVKDETALTLCSDCAGIGARLLSGSYYGQTVQIWSALTMAAIMASLLIAVITLAERLTLNAMGARP